MRSVICSIAAVALATTLAGVSASSKLQTSAVADATLAVIQPEAIRAHMRFLADDLLEGRGTGTRGYELAARYVSSQYEQLRLPPAAKDGTYFQPVPLRRITLNPDASSLEVVRDGKADVLTLGRDFVTSGHELHTDTSVEAPIVFVGYGVTAPQLGYDDYTGMDVRGAVVAMLGNAPPRFPSAERAHFASRDMKAANAARRGAVGVISLWTETEEKQFPWTALARILRRPTYRWLDPQGTPHNAYDALRASAALSLDWSRALFAGSKKSYEQVFADAQQSRPQAFRVPVTLRMRRAARHETVVSPNVVAVLRGSDAKLRDEYVVYSAHLDHEGIGEPRDGDAIYNGALDNASGVAQMLEAARAFASLPTAPRRSVMFVAVTAEEEGLLGSDYFANYPPIPVNSIVANVNLDGGLILYPGDAVVHGADQSSLGATVQTAAKRLNILLSPDPAPQENFFIRSDQYSFVKKGIPAVFVFPGMKSTDARINGQARFAEYLSQRYHTPQDDMSQEFSFEAGAIGARFNFLIGYAIAQQQERPRWNSSSFFGKTFGAATLPR